MREAIPQSREFHRRAASIRPRWIPRPRKTTHLYFGTHVSYYLHVSQKITYSNGDQVLGMLAALASPHRLRIIAALAAGGRNYVSQLARELQISRPLLHLHLQKLESAGLVTSQLELSPDGKALNYFEVCPFEFVLTPAFLARATKSLTSKSEL